MEKIKLLLYCCKQPPYLYPTATIFSDSIDEWRLLNYDKEKKAPYSSPFGDLVGDFGKVNGKIVAECDFEVEEIECKISVGMNGIHDEYTTKSLGENELLYASKIDEITFINYLKGKNGYAIHIKNLHIFDKPKELNECWANTNAWIFSNEKLYVAPQNMRYCGDWNLKKAILISIRPEWLCKILNGEKTIEVRRKVLKEMITDA